MDISQSNGASAPPAEEQVRRTEEAAAGGNLVEGDPSASGQAPQASIQAERNIAQGDNATPLETGLRQRGNVESQRAAEAKAARDTALAASNRERRQSNSEPLKSSWIAWVQAWICCPWSRQDRSSRRPQQPATSLGKL
jgi:hypothetical protein